MGCPRRAGLRDRLGGRRSQFHPGVDDTAFARSLGIPAGARVLLSPRQWNANSNVASIIAAHAQLDSNVYLIVKSFPGRGGDALDEAERAIERSPAGERIRTVGDVDASMLPSMYASAEVVISTCGTDGTPVSVLEAMAAGRYVIALKDASLAEWVAEPGGRLVETPAPDAIARAVKAFLDDPEAAGRATEHSSAVIAARADRETEFRRMGEIYDRLVEQRAIR